jgi:hypothetical protein
VRSNGTHKRVVGRMRGQHVTSREWTDGGLAISGVRSSASYSPEERAVSWCVSRVCPVDAYHDSLVLAGHESTAARPAAGCVSSAMASIDTAS